jgi:hypothetical protein
MDIQKLKSFFMWCTIINGGLLVLSAALCTFIPDWLYSIHGKLYHIPNETLRVIFYSFLGLFKIFWLIFNVTPYITLFIMGKK